MEKELIEYFLKRYLPREEIVYRLPLSQKIDAVWPLILEERKSKATVLPLNSWNGHPYWFVPTEEILASGDKLAEIARTEELNRWEQYAHEDSVVDEAYYSSVIEGACSTRQRAHELVENNEVPKNKDELMVANNYRALQFALEHLDDPVNNAIILEIGRLLTDGTLEKGVASGYRTGPVNVISLYQEIVYQAPDAKFVPGMMKQLLDYINNPEIHPVIKACVSHFYFVTIHPFNDGNGRTARALSYMILLKASYDYFRQVPISGLLSMERSKYYKALRMSQSVANGYDITYFLNYYTDMLVRTTQDMHKHLSVTEQLGKLQSGLADAPNRDRLLKGAKWILTENLPTVTTEKWRIKFDVSFETARQDLNTLADKGLLNMRVVGRKHYYDV